jgi:hypothetical protein
MVRFELSTDVSKELTEALDRNLVLLGILFSVGMVEAALLMFPGNVYRIARDGCTCHLSTKCL